jgi:tRNA threonylcarbamoyl adenosine modification protein (Sua5/YciO/YrdC/YwlC family)
MTALLTMEECADILRGGGVVAVPTDTVYGLAASLGQAQALADIFRLKDRPRDVSLPIMVADIDTIAGLGIALADGALALADAFWPGALTIVVPVPSDLAALVGATSTLGFRIPNRTDLRSLLRLTGPLAVTSANLHRESPCTTAASVVTAFRDRGLIGVLDGGDCDGMVSTVVSLESQWRVLRHGGVSTGQLAHVLARTSLIDQPEN